MVAGGRLVAALAGWALLALLERFTARARTIWTAIALLVALLSSDDFGSSVERAAHGQVLWPAHGQRSAVNAEQHGRWTGSGECCSSTRVERRGAQVVELPSCCGV
jgi:hypothetical protein